MADPYAGIFFDQGEGQDDTPWFFDFGLGMWGGFAAWAGGGHLIHKANKPQDLIKSLRTLRTKGPQRAYKALREDIFAAAKERSIFGTRRMGTRNINARLMTRARQSGTSVIARYGGGLTGAGTRIAIGGIGRMAMTALEIVGGLYIGAQMAQGLATAISDWEPAPAKGPALEFGSDNFYMPRAATTQRMRALQSIHNSQLTTRAALGNEATFLHN